MGDLQSFLEKMPLDDALEMSAAFDTKKPHKRITQKIFDCISTVWMLEKGKEITETECTDEIVQKFNISLILWTQIKMGIMELKEGRIALTSDSARFGLTTKGTSYVENKLLPKK